LRSRNFLGKTFNFLFQGKFFGSKIIPIYQRGFSDIRKKDSTSSVEYLLEERLKIHIYRTQKVLMLSKLLCELKLNQEKKFPCILSQ